MSFFVSLGAALSLFTGQGNFDRFNEPDFKEINKKLEIISKNAIKDDAFFKGFSLKFDEAFSNLEKGRLGFEFNTAVAKSYWSNEGTSLKIKASAEAGDLAGEEIKVKFDLDLGLTTDLLAFVRENVKRAKIPEADVGNPFEEELARLLRTLESAQSLEDIGAFLTGFNNAVEKYGKDTDKEMLTKFRFRYESDAEGKLEAISIEAVDFLDKGHETYLGGIKVAVKIQKVGGQVSVGFTSTVGSKEVLSSFEQLREGLGLIQEGDEETLAEISEGVKGYLEIVKSFVLEGTTWNFDK